jgi:hypothetical protein
MLIPLLSLMGYPHRAPALMVVEAVEVVSGAHNDVGLWRRHGRCYWVQYMVGKA